MYLDVVHSPKCHVLRPNKPGSMKSWRTGRSIVHDSLLKRQIVAISIRTWGARNANSNWSCHGHAQTSSCGRAAQWEGNVKFEISLFSLRMSILKNSSGSWWFSGSVFQGGSGSARFREKFLALAGDNSWKPVQPSHPSFLLFFPRPSKSQS